MYNFPDTPTLNQVVTGPGGIQYRWDGAKWVSGNTPSSYLPLTGGTVSGNLTVTGTATLPNAVAEPALGNVGRSYIHNGVFNIWQRGAGPFGGNAYNADRWTSGFVTTGGAVSIQRATAADADRAQVGDEAFVYSFQVGSTAGTGAGDATNIAQPIENVYRLSGKTVIVSFWAKALTAGLKIGIELYQNFGTGGSPSALVLAIGAQAVTLTTSWQRYVSSPIAIPSVAGKTVGTNGDHYTSLSLWFNAGANFASRASNIGFQTGTFGLYGIQLEVAQPGQTLPTPLDYGGSPQQQLAECQRFYSAGAVSLLATTAGASYYLATMVGLPVTMRAQPTVGFTVTGNSNATGLLTGNTGASGFVFYCQSTAATLVNVSANWTASADL